MLKTLIYNFNKSRLISNVVFLILTTGMVSCHEGPNQTVHDSRPNILLIVADDLGYADLGSFGGEIETPNIDALAARGIRFSRFHTAPMCAPTRAMLLTGNDNHIAGVGRQNLRTSVFGYEGHLTNRVVTAPTLLRKSGYETFMAGKWHLGHNPEHGPQSKGFDHSYVLLEGVGNHYNGKGIFKDSPGSNYIEDGKPFKWKDGDYSTDVYTDKLIEYMSQNKTDERPFFAFAAYTSPHWPLQVDEKYSSKYKDQYNQGYDVLKRQRFERLKKSGIIPRDAIMPLNDPSIRPWDDLSEEEKSKESRKMEIYAGMVSNLDENVGRLIQHLKEIGEYDNTVIIFMSDNGAASEDYFNDAGTAEYISDYYNNDYETMGEPTSLLSYGPPWAEAGSSPFRYYKEYTTNGGIVTPLIMSGPRIKNHNAILDNFLTVMDIAPTLLEFAQTSYPKRIDGKTLYPIKGKSLLPFISGETNTIHGDDYVFGLEHIGYTMLRKGSWKLTNIDRPFSEENFKLYNIVEDPGELRDLKEKEQSKFHELLQEWRTFSKETKIQLPK
jgi:arylsulfatase